MKVLDLFSGVGGFALAFDRAGFETVAFSEVEPFPCKVLRHHWPDVPNLGSVMDIDGAEVRERFGHIDVVTFGSPCQDWSVAGKRLGLEGQRSSLFHEAIRIIRGVRPTFAVFENVPGLFSAAEGWDFAAVLDEMAESGALDIAWSVLDAQWFGVPQRRRRIFLIADFGGEGAGEILFESESVSGNIEKSGEAGEEVAGTIGGRIARSHTELDGHGAYISEVAPALRSNFYSDHDGDENRLIPEVAHSLTGEGHDASEDGTGRGTPLIPEVAGGLTTRYGKGVNTTADDGAVIPMCFSSQDNGRDAALNLAPTLRVGTGLDIPSPPAVAFAENQRGEVRESDNLPSLSTGGGKAGVGYPAVATAYPLRAGRRIADSNGNAGNVIPGGMGVRRLTPKECERLQGFPDAWTNIPRASDSVRYRALGNSVAVPVVYWIAKRLFKAASKKEAA